MNVNNLQVKGAYVPEARAVSRAHPIVASRGVPQRRELSSHNTRHQLTLCSWGAATRFNIGVFKYGKGNSTTIKHIYNESENLNESCDVAFDCNNWGNLPLTVPVLGVESMVTCAGLRYIRDYLTPATCSLIKPTAMEVCSHFAPKFTVML